MVADWAGCERMQGDESVSLWIYGSYARGEEDIWSDIDVLLIGERCSATDRILGTLPSDRVSLVEYGLGDALALMDDGAMLFQHLKAEGIPKVELGRAGAEVRKALEKLGPYRGVKRSMVGFSLGLDDLKESWYGGLTRGYDVAVLGATLRHIGILGCYVLGSPCFGRVEPVMRFAEVCGVTVDPDNISVLAMGVLRYREGWEVASECDWGDGMVKDEVEEVFAWGLDIGRRLLAALKGQVKGL